MTLENDFLKIIADKIHEQNVLIASFLKQQILEAQRTPSVTEFFTFNLLNPTTPTPIALQILPKSDRRDSVAITNAAGGDCLISEKHFDPTTILQWFNDPAFPSNVTRYNSAVPIGLLTAGNSVSLDGTTGIWAYALGSSSATSTILSIADSQYTTSEAVPKSQVAALHIPEIHPLEEPGGVLLNG